MRPILNGPVTLSISILFGTLVATTISSLYNRQTQLAQSVVATQEQVIYLALLVDGLPDANYRAKTQQLLSDYVRAVHDDVDQQNVTADTLSQPQLFAIILLLNEWIGVANLQWHRYSARTSGRLSIRSARDVCTGTLRQHGGVGDYHFVCLFTRNRSRRGAILAGVSIEHLLGTARGHILALGRGHIRSYHTLCGCVSCHGRPDGHAPSGIGASFIGPALRSVDPWRRTLPMG